MPPGLGPGHWPRGPIDAEDAARIRETLVTSGELQPDRRIAERDSDGRRRHVRRDVRAQARLRARSKIGVDAVLKDLSAGGCCLEMVRGIFAVDEPVWLSIAGVETWLGVVRRAENDQVAIEFDRPFYPSVFEHLLSVNTGVVRACAASSVRPRRVSL